MMRKIHTVILLFTGLISYAQGKFYGGISGNSYTDLNGFVLGAGDRIGIKIYPNPVKGTMNLTSSYEGMIEIVDMKGRLRTRPFKSNDPIDVSFLSAGTYFLVIDKKRIKFIKE